MNILLDTTIQIDRITGSKERKEAVEAELKGNDLYCTTYVLGEYYHTIISDYITLFALFLIDRDIGETGKRITERVFHRSQARVSKLYASIVALCDSDLDEIEDVFRLYLDILQNSFFIDLKEVINKTECAHAETKVIYEDGKPVLQPPLACRKNEEKCGVCRLWRDSIKEIDQIIAARQVSDKILDILISAREDESNYRGRNCMTLGDMIICLETLKSEKKLAVCSSNKSDFQPICDILGIELVIPDYSFKKQGT